jgi:predicted Zn-dependent peptidase
VPVTEPLSVTFLHKEMAQALVWIEQNADPLPPALLGGVEMYNTYFDGGMSGLVFQELRESRGLAYSASGYHTVPRWKGDDPLVIGRIGCQADKTPEATRKFLELFDEMPGQETRFTEAKNALLNRFETSRTGFRAVLSTVLGWERQGLTPDPRQEAYAMARTMTLADMMAFYKNRIQGKPRRIAIIGDRSIVDLGDLRKLAPVKEVTAAEIMRP